MIDFVFNLGYNEELSLLELASVSGKTPTKVADHQYQLEFPDHETMITVANRLGGLVSVTENGKIVWRFRAKDWIKRDRQKPFFDRRKGLLPPKIARILVNFALGTNPEGKTVLDPFCGSGTILMEAALVGAKVVGSDIDMGQLDGAGQNLKWLHVEPELYQADAVKLSQQIKTPVDCIVTEPYMGKVTAREDRLPDLAKGLRKLYLGCLKDWSQILKDGGWIVMVFPVFTSKGRAYPTSNIIDDKHVLGYNIKTRGLMYFRPEARVKREIVILEKTYGTR